LSAGQDRQARAASLTDMGRGTGLEIGPLDSPIALRSAYNVRYVDVVDTAGLRDKYGDDPNVVTEEIAEVDYALQGPNGLIRPLAEVVRDDAPFDWAVASHVIEHVPDLIGWLAEIAEVITDGGQLVLMIPDRRFSFDVRRPQTTIGQILQAHTMADTVPSERAVFDHFRSYVDVPTPDLWAGASGHSYPLVFTLEQAREMRDLAVGQGQYVDSHVWMFTPSVFVEQIVELGKLGLCDFIVSRVIPTRHNEVEFYTSLERLPRGMAPESLGAARARGIQSVDDRVSPPVSDQGGTADPEPVGGPADPALATEVALSKREVQLIQFKRRAMRRIRER
jgi:SAM-dependent methyltransferase